MVLWLFTGMIALRRSGTELIHNDFTEAVGEVQAKKKKNVGYIYA
jgi:26S proteasome regulatory subunit T5